MVMAGKASSPGNFAGNFTVLVTNKPPPPPAPPVHSMYTGDGIRFTLVFFLMFSVYLLVYFAFVAGFGWSIGRERWWAGPYFTGIMLRGNFGDGSLAEQPFQRLLARGNMHTEDPALYFAPPHAPLVRMPLDLAIRGFRSRADDVWERPREISVYDGPAVSWATLSKQKSGVAAVATTQVRPWVMAVSVPPPSPYAGPTRTFILPRVAHAVSAGDELHVAQQCTERTA